MSEERVERIYTIPLRGAWAVPRHRRAEKAMFIIRAFVKKHMKAKEVKITTEVNEKVWSKGIRNPPRRVEVKIEKDEEGVATVSLAE